MNSLLMDDRKGLKLLLNDPNPPVNEESMVAFPVRPSAQSMVAFPVRPSAQVIFLNTRQRLLLPGIPQWNHEYPAPAANSQNVEHPAAYSQPIDIPGGRFDDDDNLGFEVGSYRPPCPLLTYNWPRAIAVIPVAPHSQLRRTKSAIF